MAGAGKYASAALLAVVMIMVGAGAAAATEVTAASPSPTMEAGAASTAFVPSLFAALMASFIPFLASRF
uniref:Uncharacterized protein n=1 Tax=Picea sitchensis TaxID=3332 RepID=A9NTW1_PICSI|nr:unknown [Picea sitchensis]ABK26657.1 unknown [Picea sitchensis]